MKNQSIMVEETIQRCREHSKGCPRAEGEDPQLGIRPHWRKRRAEKSAGLPDPELAHRCRASRYQPPRTAVSKLGAGNTGGGGHCWRYETWSGQCLNQEGQGKVVTRPRSGCALAHTRHMAGTEQHQSCEPPPPPAELLQRPLLATVSSMLTVKGKCLLPSPLLQNRNSRLNAELRAHTLITGVRLEGTQLHTTITTDDEEN